MHTIEQLTPKDYYKCQNIWDMSKQPHAQKWMKQMIDGNRIIFIYKINGEFIGEGALVFDTGDSDYTIPNRRIYLSRLVVKDEYRNQGIGSKIVDFLTQKAREFGLSEIALGVDTDNLPAIHLYQKKGFTDIIFEGEDEYGQYMKLLKKL
ncbi:GNAT family N-acetyltransferase [Paludicola sp. MB14-C6]|uniref:GNAT family N-acetyltransferase n=1 Tax=Paludihabitans sp. MB14-C6 TaxID=3070656 RepID=UPI0027DDB9C1|nr:GNAT family N-acetyltransferase [Paludicola sp. MB14-C6]WMJ23980.1 GNAT family N-acetyltransferase [Paludicola sp. MB14-C6]